MFLLGMVVASLAGTIETLFTGWELVGLSSALLVAYFQERPAPARNGLWVWVVYRFSDAALLLAAVAMHHLSGEGDFDQILGTDPWPMGHATITSQQAFIVGLLMLVAAAGKSALVPFSGWLPRAMEGPTPSSAVFYGALSVHLGAFLLLRISPILDAVTAALPGIVLALGLVTAGFAYLAGSVQTDIKSALAYASLTQVAIIVVEIGLGFRYVALIHLLGHACLRTLQFLRAPTLLHDYHTLENAIGDHLPEAAAALGPPGDRPRRGLDVPAGPRAGLPRHASSSNTWSGRSSGHSSGATAWSGAGPTSCPAAPRASRTRSSPISAQLKSFHEYPPDPLAGLCPPDHADRLPVGEPAAGAGARLLLGPGVHRHGAGVHGPRLAGVLPAHPARGRAAPEPAVPPASAGRSSRWTSSMHPWSRRWR